MDFYAQGLTLEKKFPSKFNLEYMQGLLTVNHDNKKLGYTFK